MGIFRVALPPVDFHPELFNNLLLERGLNVTWEKGTMCPCVRADSTGRTSFICGDCNNGIVYFDPQSILAVVTNITGQRNAAVWGELALGGVFITVNGDYRLSVNDRIVLKDSTARYSELGSLATAKVKIAAVVGDVELNLDHTRKFPTQGTMAMYARVGDNIFSYTGKSDTKLTGIPDSGPFAIPDSGFDAGSLVVSMVFRLRYKPLTMFDLRTTEKVFVAPDDYEMTGNGLIWFKDTATVPQAAFTVLYDAYPVYLVDSMAHEYRDQLLKLGYKTPTLARLPVAVVGRKDFLNLSGASGTR